MKTKTIHSFFKIALALAMIFVAMTDIHAQKKEKKQKEQASLTRPANVGAANIDGFKDNSFNIYSASMRLDKELDLINEEINVLESATEKDDSKKKEIEGKLNNSQKEAMRIQKEATKLLGNSSGMLASAKKITPKTKSPKAVKNVNVSVKALNQAKDNVSTDLQQIPKQMERLKVL